MIGRIHQGAGLAALASALAFCPVDACAQPQDAAERSSAQVYDLPEQELSSALRTVAARNGLNLIVPADLVSGRRSPALRGRYTAQRAVEALLAGTGLQLRWEGQSLVISGAPLAHAAAEPEAQSEIVVTGTNIRGAPPTSQVLALDREMIEASGRTSVEELMRTLPQNSNGGVGQENFGLVGAGADITEHGAGVNLRGLGQRATLVLVNGRRVAPSGGGSFVDVSLIPVSALDRVEVLTDGASAIYGSDAVGGVVNFILRKRFDGFEGSVLAGLTTRGGGEQVQTALTFGQGWASGRALLAYEFRLEDPVVARDRDFTIGLQPDTSIVPRERRHSIFGVVDQEITNRFSAEFMLLHSQRDTRRSYFYFSSLAPIDTQADAWSTTASATLRYDAPRGWRVELSAGYSVTRTEQNQTQPGGQGLINDRDITNELVDLGLKTDGTLVDLPGGPVRLAFGAQFRRERYVEGFATSSNRPTVQRAIRKVGALFGEISLPLVSRTNRLVGVEQLVLTGAVRYEHYDGFGSTVNPKLGVLWSPFQSLTLRGSYDTSFRAPLLSETTAFYNAFYFPAPILAVAPGQPDGVALVLVGSNPDVRPETSRTWTIGAELQPHFSPGLRLTANYYDIRFSDRIGLPSETVAILGDPAFESLVTRSPSASVVADLLRNATLLIDFSGPGFSNGNATPGDVTVIVDDRINNSAVTRTRGLDLTAHYGFDSGAGRFDLSANSNFIFSFEDQLTVTSPPVETLDTPYHPLGFRARVGVAWAGSGWKANAFLNHASAYRDNRGTRDERVRAFDTVDASLSYAFGRAGAGSRFPETRLALAVLNLFDAPPPRLLPDPGSTTGLGYDPVNASGRGRFISVQLQTKW